LNCRGATVWNVWNVPFLTVACCLTPYAYLTKRLNGLNAFTL